MGVKYQIWNISAKRKLKKGFHFLALVDSFDTKAEAELALKECYNNWMEYEIKEVQNENKSSSSASSTGR